jgi:hypothetical protein
MQCVSEANKLDDWDIVDLHINGKKNAESNARLSEFSY